MPPEHTPEAPPNPILEAALAALRRLGLEAEQIDGPTRLGRARADARLRVRLDGHETNFAAQVREGLTLATLGTALAELEPLGHEGLLVADRIADTLADELRGRGVAFVDGAGNAYLRQTGLLVWARGQRAPRVPGRPARKAAGRAFQPGGLRVLFALLCRPEWANAPYRELAGHAGVAHGTVGGVMTELETLGFIARVAGRRRLLNAETLLGQWCEAYVRTLMHRLELGRYRAEDADWWRTLDAAAYGMALGGEAAAARLTGHLRPETVTLYGARAEPRLLLEHRLRADPAGDVIVRERFWNFTADDPALAPVPLVYADLLATGDARCLEVARLLLDRLPGGPVRKA
jgi:hypothetical protein